MAISQIIEEKAAVEDFCCSFCSKHNEIYVLLWWQLNRGVVVLKRYSFVIRMLSLIELLKIKKRGQ